MRKSVISGLLVTMALLASREAYGQDHPVDSSFGVQRFLAAPGPDNFLTVDGARVGGHLQFSLGLMDVFQYKPLVIYDYDGGELSEQRTAIIEYHDQLELSGSISLFEWVQIGLALPFTVYQKGEGFDPETAQTGGGLETAGGLGDPRLAIKVRFYGKHDEDGLGVAFVPVLTFPVGGYGPWGETFSGEKLPTVHARFALDYKWAGLHAAVNVGYMWREEHQLYSTYMEDELTYGGAVSYRVHDYVTLMGEIFGSVALTTCKGRDEDDCKATGIFTASNTGMPLEAGGGLRLHVWQLDIDVGGMGGIIPAVGTPMFRVYLGLKWIPRKAEAGDEARSDDQDLDGILDEDDACPEEAEDYDNFEDKDGCPEEDNDGDGVIDGYDSCPLEPEDEDGFEDEDGCPDLDHDGDGIPIPEDECPDEAEDIDAFEDEDGCPEADNDQDGMPDVDDLCPDEAEDLDGFEDEDGCPDRDNDEDGIPDADDKCPGKAEVFNGRKDEDGCPDKGKTLVVITKEQIEIKQQVHFATDSDEIVGKRSFRILDVVASILKANPHLKVEVQGHTDTSGGYEHNMDLSQRRAESVMSYLVEQGVDPENLTAKGYGPDMPIASNKTKKGRAENRRVEFHIVTELEEDLGESMPAEEDMEISPEETGGGEEDEGDYDMSFDVPE
jgi:outer membrane protein OmpA-like peptidoglycan-associated protein